MPSSVTQPLRRVSALSSSRQLEMMGSASSHCSASCCGVSAGRKTSFDRLVIAASRTCSAARPARHTRLGTKRAAKRCSAHSSSCGEYANASVSRSWLVTARAVPRSTGSCLGSSSRASIGVRWMSCDAATPPPHCRSNAWTRCQSDECDVHLAYASSLSTSCTSGGRCASCSASEPPPPAASASSASTCSACCCAAKPRCAVDGTAASRMSAV
mmetsp:Transcript_74469/g.205270  ORF Transcript_74469/g.205270 Transcript_74469/m.205270 type:complete len:214 (-) Transcript_74469:644-1285(-)